MAVLATPNDQEDALRWRAVRPLLQIQEGLLIFDGPYAGNRRHYLWTRHEASLLMPGTKHDMEVEAWIDEYRTKSFRLYEMG